MLKAVILFYFKLLLQFSIRPQWMESDTPDPHHFHRRRYTTKYKKKKQWVEKLWLGVLILMLLFPSPPLIASMFLITTFMSFSILDETK